MPKLLPKKLEPLFDWPGMNDPPVATLPRVVAVPLLVPRPFGPLLLKKLPPKFVVGLLLKNAPLIPLFAEFRLFDPKNELKPVEPKPVAVEIPLLKLLG